MKTARPAHRNSKPGTFATRMVSDRILRRVYILFGLFILFSAAIVFRILSLQLNKSRWVQQEMEEQVFFKRLEADRGNILSAEGAILAASLPFYRIALDPTRIDTARVPNFQDSLYTLAVNLTTHFDAPEDRDTLLYISRIREAILKGDRHIYLTRKKLNFKELEMARQWPILSWGRYQGGFIVERLENERFYPMGDLARITLGRLSSDSSERRGIEHSFDTPLRGADGYFLAQKVVGDSYVPLTEYGQQMATDGYDVVTTLDLDMQDIVSAALKQGVQENQAQFGTAILIEVATGQVKAVANYPEAYNYAYAMQVEPGSTFKTVSAAALMEDGFVDVCDTIDTGNGTIRYGEQEISDSGIRLGKTEFQKVFAYSSNVGISKTVNEYYARTPECYMEHLKNFGFSDVMNTQLKGEPAPQMIRPEDPDWTVATLPSLSYGYSIRVTPMQMAAFYNGIANRGRLMRPYVVQEIRDDARVIERFGPEVINAQMCSPQTAVRVREMMKGVTEYGTAASAFRGLPFSVAGKTGTARKVEEGVGYVKKYRASFGGFFPADNPRFTLYIMLEEPIGSYISGGTVAAPIFRRIAEEIYRIDSDLARPPADKSGRPGSKPSLRTVHAPSAQEVFAALDIPSAAFPAGSQWVSGQSNGHQVNVAEYSVKEQTVPNLRGMTSRDAVYMLENMGVKVELRGTGRVRAQSLMPGHRIPPGSTVVLFLG